MRMIRCLMVTGLSVILCEGVALGESRWSQVEASDSADRLEMTLRDLERGVVVNPSGDGNLPGLGQRLKDEMRRAAEEAGELALMLRLGSDREQTRVALERLEARKQTIIEVGLASDERLLSEADLEATRAVWEELRAQYDAE